jgi:DNA invertase Pin-like site-specific DNA recombinase
MGTPTTKRCALYARFSTDKQSNDSAEAQIDTCRRFAAERGWDAPDDLVFADPAVSGASRANRPGR